MGENKKDLKDKDLDQKVEDQNVEETTSEKVESSDENELKEEVSLEDKLTEDLAKEKDRYLRLFAEFENYKKRTSKERIDLFRTANSELMIALLPVLDDFDRGMVEIEKSEDKALVEGVQLIHNKLKDILATKNLELVEIAAGDDFDSEIHDAITQIPAPSEDLKGKIVDVVEKGYKLGDKIIRHPKVVLGIK